MKLAKALNERKALKDTLARLMERLEANARVQAGGELAEAPAGCLAVVVDGGPRWWLERDVECDTLSGFGQLNGSTALERTGNPTLSGTVYTGTG